MKKPIKVSAVILLLFTTISAVFGGWMLISAPDGSRLQMPIEFLSSTPFSSYLVPGIILLVANGLFSLFIAVATLLKFRTYPLLIVFQGIILCGWIISQISLIKSLSWFHLLYGLIGILLYFAGLILLKEEKTAGLPLTAG